MAGVTVLPVTAQGPGRSADLTQTLLRVGQRLERWYSRAQTIVSTENVWIQPLRSDLTPADFPRRLAFELRVGWDPERAGSGVPEASVMRQRLSVNGRPSRGSEPGCLDPKPVSPEPLSILLPSRLKDSDFSLAGSARVDGRAALRIDYRGLSVLPPDITWTDQCVSVSLPGRSKGRIWVDAETYDVLRMDEQLVGMFEFDVPREQLRLGSARSMVIERAESSIRYRRVQFQNPEEVLMLPAMVETLTVIRGSGTQRVRITQRFSDYRRFLTAGRVLP